MKETVKVNLSGRLFNLDNDAYVKLKNYLDSIERQFSGSPDEAKEILEDIEARISEILQSKYINTEKQVISLSDVEQVIAKLGTAEDIGGQGEPEAEPTTNSQQRQRYSHGRKRFYRDVDNSVLGGVSSGIAAYLGIDPLWIRLLFIVLVFAKLFGVLIYIILWAAIPAARTTAQKLEMRGEDVNVENIKNSVKNEYTKVKDGVKNFSKSKEYRRAEGALAEFFKALGNILVALIKVIGIIILVSLIIGLISIFFGVAVGGAFFPHGFFHGWNWDWNWSHGIYWPHFTWIGICLFLVIVIPIFGLFARMMRWMFNIPRGQGFAAGIGATIWAVSLVLLIVLLINNPNKDLFRNSFTSEYTFSTSEIKKLKIDIKDMGFQKFEHYHILGHHFVWNDEYDELMGSPAIEICESEDDKIVMKLKREFFCINPDKPRNKINNVAHYNWSMEDNTLLLGEYFSSNEVQLWRFPKMKIIIYIPEGTEFYYSDDAADLIEEIIYLDDSRIDNYAEKILEIKDDHINDKN